MGDINGSLVLLHCVVVVVPLSSSSSISGSGSGSSSSSSITVHLSIIYQVFCIIITFHYLLHIDKLIQLIKDFTCAYGSDVTR